VKVSGSKVPRISVVVCAYTQERWSELLAAISSLRHQRHPPAEVIVVVDHNPELRRLLRLELPDVKVVENTGEHGLAAARNTGVAVATGSIVAFLDDDAVADFDWLHRLAAGYADPDVVGVGGSIEPLWESGRPRGFPAEFDWVVGCTYRGMPEVASVVRNVIGANMSFRRDALLGSGSFHPQIGRIGTQPVGCEETDLCIRATRDVPNGKILYDPEARVSHRVPVHRSGWTYFKARCYGEGLSKATVARRAGLRTGLASERSHALKELPRAVARGVLDALHGDLYGLVRAGAVIIGLTVTTIGFAVGMITTPTRPVPGSA
jgi:glucosyl-dolichyl phosphate glucuronosyltransferase